MNNIEFRLRQQLIQYAILINDSGINQGTSGNLSVRFGSGMLITPSGIPYTDLIPDSITYMELDNPKGIWQGTFKPSTEWRFHRDLLNSRPDINAIIHTHSPYATSIAITRRPIPAIHYMIAAFGGHDIRCADYATFGTEALSEHVLTAMQDRLGCLMANHGMLVGGNDLTKALWLAVELENLARQYYHSLQIGNPHILSEAEINEALAKFKNYGLQGTDFQS
ncbi:MAG: class II aldolase/adducin family protein [Thiofilum sp.]|uniref:class II aldolase/adducin family protein n=1 Tax=Thiofilum sp. TaxID=2212733 RepID=UPI0025DA730B|nr:class II aldolase/adducin family protein [Thiofilum sp.]MBK8452982.1 class II aldolase/adducin family protein [Thiofilum sp.]